MAARSNRIERMVPTLVELEGPLTHARQQAEQFVWRAFNAAYDADITQFMPSLMTLRGDDGGLLAVLGLRAPDRSPMFLEQYLGQPAESMLETATGCAVDRSELIEVGNFAVGAAGGGRWLITALTAFLYSAGKQWAIFTCGPELRNAFHRMGIPLLDLAPADPGTLPTVERSRWGSYYDQKPRVMAASVATSHEALANVFKHECALCALWRVALQAGRLAA